MECKEHDWVSGTFIVIGGISRIKTKCTICKRKFFTDFKKSYYMIDNSMLEKLKDEKRKK